MNEMLQRLIEERARVWESAKAVLDAAETNENRSMTGEQEGQYEAHSADLAKLDQRIASLQAQVAGEKAAEEARRALTVDPREVNVDEARADVAQAEEYRSAFEAYLRGGIQELDVDQRRTLQLGFLREESRAQSAVTGNAGGYTVPQGFYSVLTEAMKFFGGMWDNKVGATVLETDAGNDLPMPTSDDTGNEGEIVAESAGITGQDIAFGVATLKAWKYSSKRILIPWELLMDSGIDIEAYVAKIAGTRIGRIGNRHFTVGTGTNQPQGVVVGATVGVTAASATAVTFDELIDLEHAVDPAYRDSAVYMLNDSVVKSIRKLKDSQNRYIWQPSVQAGVPSTLNGKAYVTNNHMASMAINAKTIAFGDFSNYMVRRVKAVTLIRLNELYAESGQVGFFAWARLDGRLLDAGSHPVAVLQQAAA